MTVMRNEGRISPKSRIGHVAGFWMVVFALGLAIAGMILALQQARSITIRLMSEAEAQAARAASDARDRFDRDLNSFLQRIGDSLRTHGQPRLLVPEELPVWISGLFVWDGNSLDKGHARGETVDRVVRLIEARLVVRSMADFVKPERRVELLYDSLDDKPVVAACFDVEMTPSTMSTIVALLDLDALRTHLVESVLPAGSALEVVPVSEASMPWSQPLSGPLRYWAIGPTSQFIHDQQSAVLRQTLVYLGLTVMALVTLLGATWFLIRLARREMALAELKANFVADVSHELKTPLALIRMFAETLQSGRVPSDEKRNEYYGIILRESTRLTNLINNILDFARIEAGKKIYSFESVDAGEVVKDTYAAYTAQLDACGFEHRLSIEPNLPAIYADRDAISQAVLNLVNNAVKYSPDERHLLIEVAPDTRRGRKGVLISVHDRGIGIRPEDRQRLTEGFFRAADGRVRDQGGTGLGLALVKHIVDEHRGTLDIESRLIKGSTFRIFLPAAAEGTERDTPSRDQGEPRKVQLGTSAALDLMV